MCTGIFLLTSRKITVIGMKKKSEFFEVYQDFMRKRGIPHTLRQDNAKSEMSEKVLNLQCDMFIADKHTEPYIPLQNSAEKGGVRFLKLHAEVLMNRFGCPNYLWYTCHDYICTIHESGANEHFNWETPLQKSDEGTPDTYCHSNKSAQSTYHQGHSQCDYGKQISLDLTDLFTNFLVEFPAVICFILNASVGIKSPRKSMNGLQLSNIIPELGEK